MKYNYSYFQKLYDDNYRHTSFDTTIKQRIDRFQRIAKFVHKGDNVLDFGGGDGDLYTYLPKVTFEILDLSNEHKLGKYKRVHLEKDMYINAKNKNYDLVVMSEILEHIPNCYETLGEVKRVLKDDGTLIITVPNPFAAPFILKSVFGRYQDPSKEHLYWFDWSYLSNLLEAAGFTLIHKTTFCLLPSKVYQRIYWIDKLLSRILPNNGAQLFCVFRKSH